MVTRATRPFMTVMMIAAVALFLTPAIASAATCENLTGLAITQGTVTRAQVVAAGAFTQGGGGGARGGNQFGDLKAFCRVEATLKPSSDSDIKIEVWLPVEGWNNKFEAVGNGGWTGSIAYPAMADALRRGYAAASTDTGHSGGAQPLMGHPEKVVDFGYRAVHEMTVKAKAIINAFYGAAPRYAYWNGCSAGGRQGLQEAQRYPADFDGIIAGAPAINFTGRATQAVWIGQATHKSEDSAIPQSKFALIHDAVLNQCDSLDGVKDGVLENPMQCKFDPKVLECKAGDAASCLTPAQVETARAIYAPVVNSRTKAEIFPGLSPGSENGWNTMAGQRPFSIGVDYFQYVLFGDPGWDYRTLNFDSDMTRMEKADNGTINALDPNLKPFFDRGGKIIQYHGWADPQIASMSSVTYYRQVLDKLGGATKVQANHRLFMVPGMAHCGGGDGPNSFDMLTALEDWVEKGKAPEKVIASRQGRTRPLCPFPQVATYNGSGNTDDAANFTCK
ncbi:MAG TPA: tannase/feruloyl esterase family alpha/beta hydrolase [Terriglobia bacterium]|nr:tannase/feruloyl esterase family alpha/beta hydrolase [Terriglobia bacterium]